MELQGSIPPMVTPIVDDSGAVNTDVLRRHTEFLIDGGVDGLFPCGSTGEFSSLTREQRATVVETVVDASGNVPVYVGCGDSSVNNVARLIDDTEAIGGDAAVVVTPYYLEITQASLAKFFTTIADRSPIPIVLYEIPSLTGNQFAVETVATLAEHDNIVGLKSSMRDILRFYELVQVTPASFDVLTGLPELTVPSLDSGGSGVIAGPANVFPETVSEAIAMYRQGEHDVAVELVNDVILPILTTIRSMPTVPAIKHLLSCRGFDVGPALQPMPELSRDQQSTLETMFDQLIDSPLVAVDA